MSKTFSGLLYFISDFLVAKQSIFLYFTYALKMIVWLYAKRNKDSSMIIFNHPI